MSDDAKRYLLIGVAVAAVGLAVYVGTQSLSEPREEVIGTLPSPPGGLRDAERGGTTTSTSIDPVTGEEVADVASGMPADMVNPGK